ncbi:MAG: glycosyl hydrolase [Fibrobacteres bacterium]|nr:glycosyl hydrolase [Fibrobacterota bacterium]
MRTAVLFLGAFAACGGAAVDLGTYKGCAANDGEFKQTQLWKGPMVPSTDSGNGALKMALVASADGPPDIYFVQKQGTIKRYNGKDSTVDSLGTIPVDFMAEYGLVGIAARRDFRKDPALYVLYSFLEADRTLSFRLSRFRFKTGLTGLDPASEKILIKIPRKRVSFHTGGAMDFDEYGDLWVAIGDNQLTELGPGNTADLRGGILRIHPDESAKGYSIPSGNFGEHLSKWFKAQGNADLAAQYADTAKVKPEIYVKGTRNAYTMTLDPVRRWVTWGDVGPDQQKISEENNLVKEPYYMGWPYFAGEEDMGGVRPYDITMPTGALRSGPINNAAITGVKQLPPIREPIFARPEGCTATGPIFRYDGSLKGANQFPPQFDRKWMISGCDSYGFHILTLDSAGETITARTQIFSTIRPPRMVDLKQGPDGALYYLQWGSISVNSGIFRIDYTGACKDPALLPEKAGCATPGFDNYDPKLPKAFNNPALCKGGTGLAAPLRDAGWLKVDGRSISIEAQGIHALEILDIRGRIVFGMEGEGAKTYRMPPLAAPAVYQLRVRTDLGTVIRGISTL